MKADRCCAHTAWRAPTTTPSLNSSAQGGERPTHLALAISERGDSILVGRKSTGTLIQDNLLAGEALYLLVTGTGMAPFISFIKDPDIYVRVRHVVLVHGCRFLADLAYSDYITSQLPNGEFLEEAIRTQFLYYPTVTRESFRNIPRITTLLRSGKLQADLGFQSLDRDRVMLCDSPAMLAGISVYLKEMHFDDGNRSDPAHYVFQKAFVEE